MTYNVLYALCVKAVHQACTMQINLQDQQWKLRKETVDTKINTCKKEQGARELLWIVSAVVFKTTMWGPG